MPAKSALESYSIHLTESENDYLSSFRILILSFQKYFISFFPNKFKTKFFKEFWKIKENALFFVVDGYDWV